MTDTTNLFELPENKVETTSTALDSNTIHSLVSGLQEISESGLTQLPSRDITMNTDQIVIDEKLQPNYIPTPTHTNYIPKQDISNIVVKEKNSNLIGVSLFFYFALFLNEKKSKFSTKGQKV